MESMRSDSWYLETQTPHLINISSLLFFPSISPFPLLFFNNFFLFFSTITFSPFQDFLPLLLSTLILSILELSFSSLISCLPTEGPCPCPCPCPCFRWTARFHEDPSSLKPWPYDSKEIRKNNIVKSRDSNE